MEVLASSSSRWFSSLQQVLSSPLYRSATIAMFLSGIGSSAAVPQIILFLVKELRTPLPIAGLYYLTSLATPIAGYLVGAHSDRIGERLGLFRWCAFAGFVGWAGIALSTRTWMPFLITPLILSFSTAATSQLFAAVRDDLNQGPQGRSESVIATIRMAFTAGWIVGPVVGTWLADTAGLRITLWLTALCFLAQIIPVGNLKFRKVRPSETPFPETSALPPSRLRAMRPLLLFNGLFVMVKAGDFIKFGFLPVYMYQNLHLASVVRGAVIGIQPLVEFAIMPFSVMLARRIGLLWLMSGGAALAVAAGICYATIGSALGMFAGQILMGGAWSIFASLGIIIAQRLLPTAVATASAIFISSSALSSALGGLTGGFGVATVGLPKVFFIPAAFAVFAVIGFAAMARSGVLKSSMLY
jgi:MFS transporter, SET family, sugar efflux transporter